MSDISYVCWPTRDISFLSYHPYLGSIPNLPFRDVLTRGYRLPQCAFILLLKAELPVPLYQCISVLPLSITMHNGKALYHAGLGPQQNLTINRESDPPLCHGRMYCCELTKISGCGKIKYHKQCTSVCVVSFHSTVNSCCYSCSFDCDCTYYHFTTCQYTSLLFSGV